MAINIQIPKDRLTGFSGHARKHLEAAVNRYATDLIDEANRIEAGRNLTSSPPEVVRRMVEDAEELLRRGLGTPKSNWKSKVLRIVASALLLLVGIMYDADTLQDEGDLQVFVFVVAFTIIVATISIIKE